MKKIMLITTGGTIASIQTDKGLIPAIDGNQLITFIPSVNNICEVSVYSLINIDSTNVYYKHWLDLANLIKENYDKFDGFIICHGTDTMSYTASALSYLIQNSKKPIVLTGAQKPINLEISDAKTNLLDSFTYVTHKDAKGVVIIFNGNVILGTRARKVRTKSFDAFSSIDYPRVAIVKDGQVIPYITNLSDETVFFDKLNHKVSLLKLIPGMDSKVLEVMLENNDAVIIESFGVGGLPTYEDDDYNKLIDKYDSWDVDKIKNRAKELIEKIEEIWGDDYDYILGSNSNKNLENINGKLFYYKEGCLFLNDNKTWYLKKDSIITCLK